MTAKSSKQLYRKLYFIYTLVMVGVVLAMLLYFVSRSRQELLENNLERIEATGERAAAYIQSASDISNSIREELYRSTGELWDLLEYLTLEQEEYLEYRLQTFMTYEDSESAFTRPYKGIDDFVNETMESYENILRIEVYSYGRGELTGYYPSGKNYRNHNKEELVRRLKNRDFAAEGELSFLFEIIHPQNLQNVGCMLITFDAEPLRRIQKDFTGGGLSVYNQAGTAVLPMVEKKLDSYTWEIRVHDYTILSYMGKSEAGRLSASFLFAAAGVGMAAIVFGELLVSRHLRNLHKRLNYILSGMEKVTRGELDIVLEVDENGDELDVISENFNQMCRELGDYIQKSYLAEIEQKKAELAALQSQINPHFLYNTLESIRMRAICNGDREVGKMLYCMAVLFRSQIKEEDVITMAQELHYCKKYLELFEYRYKDKFTCEVNCKPEYMDIPIIKFVLQPLLENYFVHGIRMDQNDNFIHLAVEKEGEDMCLIVEDNGRGMEEKAMKERNLALMENRSDARESIGLANVNLRIKVTYGNEYGVFLEKREPEGIRVIVRFKPERKDKHEESNAGGR